MCGTTCSATWTPCKTLRISDILDAKERRREVRVTYARRLQALASYTRSVLETPVGDVIGEVDLHIAPGSAPSARDRGLVTRLILVGACPPRLSRKPRPVSPIRCLGRCRRCGLEVLGPFQLVMKLRSCGSPVSETSPASVVSVVLRGLLWARTGFAVECLSSIAISVPVSELLH